MNFFNRLLNHHKLTSKEMAKNRLRMVLMHDRANLPPGKIELLKDELAQVTAKYVEIDLDGINVSLSDSDRRSCLTANFPVTRLAR
jgi:cell division topological specificity factor